MNEELIERLILEGAIEVSGIDSETGNFLYQFTDKIFEIVPALHQAIMNDFENEITFFWSLGILNMDVTQDNPIVTLTPLAFEKNVIDSLTEDQRITLAYIKNVFFL
jgi:hypothetical protein